MDTRSEIAKTLLDLAAVVDDNDTVEKVSVTLTIKKPKPSKASTEAE